MISLLLCCKGLAPSTPCRSPGALPVVIAGIGTATAIAVGGNHSCALLQNGAVQCWGYNIKGELGNGTTTLSSVPVPVSGVSTAIAVAAANETTCALLAEGTVRCWGSNENGRLGNGTTTNSATPVQVSGITNGTALAVGDSSSCALLADATVKCWGGNGDGQLGNANRVASFTPSQVVGVGGRGLLSLGGTTGLPNPSADADKVFAWAEKNFPQFSPPGAVSQTILGYRYRAYGNRYYLAVNQAGTPHLYYFDNQSMTMLMDVGLLSDFLSIAAQ